MEWEDVVEIFDMHPQYTGYSPQISGVLWKMSSPYHISE
jgi:hypothetical protein